MRFVNVLLALLVSALIGLAVLEGGLRLLGLGPQRTLNQFDPVTGWSKVPGLRLARKHPDAPGKLHFQINAFGLRDDAVATPKKPAGVFRVLALGDSFTLGFGVERDDLFVEQLERHWNREGRKVEVWNVGTEGWSTDQEAAWLEAHGAEWQPDLVLLLPYENDVYWNSQEAYIGGKQKPRYSSAGRLEKRELVEVDEKTWRSRWALTKWLEPKPDASAHVFTPAGGSGRILKEWAPLLVSPPEWLEDSRLRTVGALAAAKQQCAQLGAKLVVAPIPSHSAIDAAYRETFGKGVLRGLPAGAWSPDAPVQFFLDECGKLGIPTIDARGELRAAQAEGERLYWDKDWHFDPSGNRVFARALDAGLNERGLLPAPAGERIAFQVHEAPVREGLPRWVPVFAALWVALSGLYMVTYPKESRLLVPLKIGALLACIFSIVLGLDALVGALPPAVGRGLLVVFVLGILGFVAWKLGNRLGTIAELLKAFTLRGHWYLMPLVVILLTIGSLLVVAASSPLVAPFIYTLF